MPLPFPTRIAVACVAVALAGAAVLPSAGASPRQPDRRTVAAPPAASDAAQARATLGAAQALFAADATPASERRSAASIGAPDATMVLTRLAHSLGDLGPADRTAARAILARPGYGDTPAQGEHSYTVREATPRCDGDVCVHFVTTSKDKVSATDANHDTVPDYVHTVQATMAHVWTTEVGQLGYAKPMDDSGVKRHGPNGQLDVYLQDLPAGLYGYCAPDTGATRSSGYCVLDNDYTTSEFPRHTPVQNLDVTAAHEFFHAVQFGYDSDEDVWFMEGTAAWMEDQVYDSVDDNRQYLAQSPLSDPYLPLDYSDSDPADAADLYLPYGNWIFWRFLSEWSGAGSTDDPAVVRDVWTKARSTYSTNALTQVLADRHLTFARAFTTFGTWNRNPKKYYSEGAGYPVAPLDGTFTLTSSKRSTGSQTDKGISHMGHGFIRFVPSTTLTGTWKLKVSVNMPDTVRGSLAQLTVHRPSGAVAFYPVPLNSSGVGSHTVGFTRSSVAWVELDLINDSTRFTCNQGTESSCHGVGRDDDLDSTFSATASR